MPELKDQLRADLTASMKSRDALKSATLRMVLTSITNAEVAGKSVRELTDEDVLTVIGAESKKRREAAEAFDAGNRPELADKERAEAAILAGYLPDPLTEAQIAAIITDAVADSGSAGAGMKAMGTVMGLVSPQVKGRADGALVAAEVKRQLGV